MVGTPSAVLKLHRPSLNHTASVAFVRRVILIAGLALTGASKKLDMTLRMAPMALIFMVNMNLIRMRN